MIVVTGAAGFIGSCMAAKLNEAGHKDLILVDDFSSASKRPNWEGREYLHKIDRNLFIDWFSENAGKVNFVFHLGARTDTTEFDWAIFEELNTGYSKEVWRICTANNIPLIYASSAATYGLGEHGYKDDGSLVEKLEPLNPYGRSKNEFDKWAIGQVGQPPFWAGLKFFNVYGPNEYHKGRMASVVLHAFDQVMEKGEVQLFRSHHPDYGDGKQLRDFIYVKDVVDICFWLMKNMPQPGLYNVGTGKAETFLHLAGSVFKALQCPSRIRFVDTPADIRDKYQYFTEAEMDKLRRAGYTRAFTSLEEGVRDYVAQYLVDGERW